jgi:hypothetical protein
MYTELMGSLISYSFAKINVIKAHKSTEAVDFVDLEARHCNIATPTHITNARFGTLLGIRHYN